MSRKIMCALLFLLMLSHPAFCTEDDDPVASLQSSDHRSEEYVAGEILVKYKPAVRLSTAAYYQQQHGIATIASFNVIGVDHLKLPENLNVEDAVKVMGQDPNVEYAEPNYYRFIEAVPNDTYLGLQWGLHNTGQDVNGVIGTADADMDAPEGWDLNTGGNWVVVAVVDSGVSQYNPDLAANLWQNPGELCGNGVDDDLNGYIDDCRGWDFVFNDNEPNDANGHGTHVAGTIAAVTNNAQGVAGVSWNAKIMALRFVDASGSGSTADAISAILYANAMGAHIQNHSWGGGGYSQALKDAIDASASVHVCAAGNGGSDGIGDNNDAIPFYPSSYLSTNIIAVAATDQNDNLAVFSNYGPTSVDVAAPGVNILSTLSTVEPGDYGYKNGTSMAAPHVSGLAALLYGWTWSSAENRTLAAVDIIQRIKATVDTKTQLSGVVSSGGRINAFNALNSGGDGGGDDDGGGGCFIATAAFGSYAERHVKVLRDFRDRYLKPHALGKAFVRFYYQHSPDWAETIRENKNLRWMVRTALMPIVGLSWLILKTCLLPLGAAVFILVAIPFAIRFKRNKRRMWNLS